MGKLRLQERQLHDGAGVAKRSHPTSKVGVAAERSYLTSKVGVAAERSHPTSKVRSGGCALLEEP